MSSSPAPAALPVLVTGATGTVGRQVVAGLLAEGCGVRAAGRDRDRVEGAFDARVEAVALDFTDPATWPAAYRGVEVAFVVRPPQLGNVRRDLLPSLQAARGAGVRHIVLLSLQGAERNRVVPHARLEEWLRASGLGWTFVRPSFFMENLSGPHAVTSATVTRSSCRPAGGAPRSSRRPTSLR
jgi:uncharacterized protein YbjT (DUF2867 family)